MEIVLNELSFNDLAPNSEMADLAISEFMKISADLAKQTKQPTKILATFSLLNQLLTENGYVLQQWLTKQAKDDKTRFLASLTKEPLVRDYQPYYFLDNQETKGFAIAQEKDLLTISYNAVGKWQNSHYKLLRIEENSEIISEYEIEANHISKTEHLAIFANWISEKHNITQNSLLQSCKTVEEFWQLKSQLYPNLIFCDNAKDNLAFYTLNNPNILIAFQRLKLLDIYVESKPNKFNINAVGCKISGESETTLNSYSNERTFQLPDKNGKSAVFELHIKFGDAFRLHFYYENQKCYIGYIGRHLPTTKYN
jgi:hypothetical protein